MSTNPNPLDILSRPYTPPPAEEPQFAEVTVGPGGVSMTQRKIQDTFVPPPPPGLNQPSQEGALLTTTANPELPLPMYDTLLKKASPDSITLGQMIVGMATRQFLPTQTITSDEITASSGSTISGSEDLDLIRELATEEPELTQHVEVPTTEATPPSPEPSNTTSPADVVFDKWIADLSTNLHNEVPALSPATKELLDAVTSTDEKVIYSNLLSLSKLSGPEEEVKVCEAKLQTLSEIIAKANKEGTYQPMQSVNQIGVLIWIRDALKATYDPEHPVLLDSAINNLATGITQANIDAVTREPLTNAEFYALSQGTQNQVEEELVSILASSDTFNYSTKQFGTEKVTTLLRALSAKIIASRQKTGDTRLQSIDKDNLLAALQELVQGITPAPSAQLLSIVIPTLVDAISDINAKQMKQWVYSSKPEKVNQALTTLTGLDSPKVEPQTFKIVHNYLQVLTAALVLLAQIRCYISQLDGMMANDATQAKLKNAADELRLSTQLLEVKLSDAQKQYEVNQAKIFTAKVLKVLMPLIAVIVALISVAITVFSGGAATPAGMFLMVAVIAASAITIVIDFADFLSAAISGKSIYEHIFEALHVEDETTKAWIQSIITIFTALITLVCSITTIATALLKAATTAADKALAEGIKVIKKALEEAIKKITPKLFTQAVMVTITSISSLVSAPIIPQAIKNALKAAGLKEDQAAIWSMVLTLLISLILMIPAALLAGKAPSGIASKIKAPPVVSLVPTATKPLNPFRAAAQKVCNFFNQYFAGTTSAPTSVGQTLAIFEEQLQHVPYEASRFIRQLIQFVLEPLQMIFQGTGALVKAISNFQIAELEKETAKKAYLSAMIEAFAQEMNQVYSLGPESLLKIINELEQASQKEFTTLVRLIDTIITGAMDFTTKLHSKGAG